MKIDFWKVSIVGLILTVSCIAPLVHPAMATTGETVQVVYPTGFYPQDVENVQAALDNGGTILLKATDESGIPKAFNFGSPEPGSGGVFIRSDAFLLGEIKDTYMTKIRGGSIPIRGSQPVFSSIQNIHFDRPYSTAILIRASRGTEITGNRITNVVGSPIIPGIRKAVGIWISSSLATPEDISGEVLIKENLIDTLDAEIGDGIALVVLGAEARIIGNEIRGVDTNGILVNGHTRPVWIERNVVVPGSGIYPASAWGNGIAAGHIFPVSPQGPVHIRNNDVICDNPFADGIALIEIDDSTIYQNKVVMDDSFFGGISLYDSVSNTTVGQNQVEGTGSFALDILYAAFSEDPQSDSNTFIGNNITMFDGLLADVFFDVNAFNTRFDGFCRSVFDFGQNNQIDCPAGHAPVDFAMQQIIQIRALKDPFLQHMQSNESVQLPYYVDGSK